MKTPLEKAKSLEAIADRLVSLIEQDFEVRNQEEEQSAFDSPLRPRMYRNPVKCDIDQLCRLSYTIMDLYKLSEDFKPLEAQYERRRQTDSKLH